MKPETTHWQVGNRLRFRLGIRMMRRLSAGSPLPLPRRNDYCRRAWLRAYAMGRVQA